MRKNILLFLKGVAMGAANVIPGVSGGTIAFITNIYEELINALKSFDLESLGLVFRLRWKEFAAHINLSFLLVLFSGVVISIISLGKVLSFLFENYPIYVWAFFFGLIIASIYYVGKTVAVWNFSSILAVVAGTAIAVTITYLTPASENDGFIYLVICGIVAMASMLLPGLSGSFVLILMGNYQLIFLEAVPAFNLKVLVPVVLGSIIGFILLSRLIAFLLARFRDGTIGLLTGFIFGSLLIIWPWKLPVYLTGENGEIVIRKGEMIIEGYNWYLPALTDSATWISVLFIGLGILLVVFIESFVQQNKTA